MSGKFLPIHKKVTHFRIPRKKCRTRTIQHAAQRAWNELEKVSSELDLLGYRIFEDTTFRSLKKVWDKTGQEVPKSAKPYIEHIKRGRGLFLCSGIGKGPFKTNELRKKIKAKFTAAKWESAQKSAHDAMAYLPEHSPDELGCPVCDVLRAFILINKRSSLFEKILQTSRTKKILIVDLDKMIDFTIGAHDDLTIKELDKIDKILTPAQDALRRIRDHAKRISPANNALRVVPKKPIPSIPTTSMNEEEHTESFPTPKHHRTDPAQRLISYPNFLNFLSNNGIPVPGPGGKKGRGGPKRQAEISLKQNVKPVWIRPRRGGPFSLYRVGELLIWYKKKIDSNVVLAPRQFLEVSLEPDYVPEGLEKNKR